MKAFLTFLLILAVVALILGHQQLALFWHLVYPGH